MSSSIANTKERAFDSILTEIVDYVWDYRIESLEGLRTAHLCFLDSLGCALLALKYPECRKVLGPIVPGAEMPTGARVPGLSHVLDPVQAAFNIGTMIRWLDFNDTWLAAEWGHPSDNLGGILACADYVGRRRVENADSPLVISDVLSAMIKAHEIQGVLALENSFNRVGLDHVLLVRIATTAVATPMLGGSREQTLNALSNAWIDGGALRAYRHAPNTGSRKSWAAGDATSRGVRLALLALQGEMGYATALSAPTWGFCDVLFEGKPIRLTRSLGSHVMENVLFKISYPAEFHAQTAVEAAIQLHPGVRDRLGEVDRVEIETQESAIRIIDKTGPLRNPADRDHCLQYMTAIGLIFGNLTADHYEDEIAKDARIDALRDKMTVKENPRYTREYLDADRRSIGNGVQVFFEDGTSTEKVAIDYPIGHRRRRDEGMPLLKQKFESNIRTALSRQQCEKLMELFENQDKLAALAVPQFMEILIKE